MQAFVQRCALAPRAIGHGVKSRLVLRPILRDLLFVAFDDGALVGDQAGHEIVAIDDGHTGQHRDGERARDEPRADPEQGAGQAEAMDAFSALHGEKNPTASRAATPIGATEHARP